jgi:hypothetical protein
MFKLLFQGIVGADLGKTRSSFTTLGALIPSRALGQAQLRVFANAATGNLYLEDHQKIIIDNNLNYHLLTSTIPLNATDTYTTTYGYTDEQHAYLASVQQSEQTVFTYKIFRNVSLITSQTNNIL